MLEERLSASLVGDFERLIGTAKVQQCNHQIRIDSGVVAHIRRTKCSLAYSLPHSAQRCDCPFPRVDCLGPLPQPRESARSKGCCFPCDRKTEMSKGELRRQRSKHSGRVSADIRNTSRPDSQLLRSHREVEPGCNLRCKAKLRICIGCVAEVLSNLREQETILQFSERRRQLSMNGGGFPGMCQSSLVLTLSCKFARLRAGYVPWPRFQPNRVSDRSCLTQILQRRLMVTGISVKLREDLQIFDFLASHPVRARNLPRTIHVRESPLQLTEVGVSRT